MEQELAAEEYGLEPVSPTDHSFNSSVLSVCILAVLESQVPLHDSSATTLLNQLFLLPRFSSVMVTDKNGSKQWKKVEVKVENHIKIPIFPSGLSLTSYDDHFSEYLSRISAEELPQTQPLWEIHIFKYPTSDAAGTVVFKLSHSLGDGYSLVGALLTCLQRADDPSLTLTFPSLRSQSQSSKNKNTIKSAALLKDSSAEDDLTPIHSGNPMVQYLPITITTLTFPLNQIKLAKTSLGVTVNDLITGIVFLGTRLYMKEIDDASIRSNSTALVILNTRTVDTYKSIKEMVIPGPKRLWGNKNSFLRISVPELGDKEASNPLEFIWQAQQQIKMRRSSLGVPLDATLRDPEITAKYIHSTFKNTTMGISNLIGPVEQMALANHPIRGLYFMLAGAPQSLTVTIISYMGKLRVAVGSEKGFIDSPKYKKSLESAYEIIVKASNETSSQEIERMFISLPRSKNWQ